jgi:hypothetical protein
MSGDHEFEELEKLLAKCDLAILELTPSKEETRKAVVKARDAVHDYVEKRVDKERARAERNWDVANGNVNRLIATVADVTRERDRLRVELKEAAARLDKWAKAERCTSEEPLPPPCRGMRITHWARVPEGEE